MIYKKYYAHSTNYTKGRTQNIEYIVVHYTANDGDTAVNNGNYFSKPNRGASAHYFVDETTILQSVEDTDTAWHCGAKTYVHPDCRNVNSLGVEMCSERGGSGQYYINEATVSNTAALVKELMNQYKIPISRVLRHYDVTGKVCPRPFVDNEAAWANFKRRLKEEEEPMEKVYNWTTEVPEWARPTIQKLLDKSYLVGNDKGELELTYSMLKLLTINDRAGLYDDNK